MTERPTEYRRQADRCRRLAGGVDELTAARLRELAAEFDAKADAATVAEQGHGRAA